MAVEKAIAPLVQAQKKSDVISGIRVLIAEDNPVNVMLMKKLLSKWNITPFIAENGERAVEFVQYGNFDIILMDLQMPVMNGFRSEEHTSELQSRFDLVCRLLLEKKKHK